ncbi:MAG TPA: C-type lectin domain-containing protein [Kofleriaceae bacterium]|nr:C-type lectin domain-containing protein [Kofleriaceae bacterium]
MRRWIALLVSSGCAQIGGLDKTTAPADASGDSRVIDTAYFDAKPCSGGDAAMLDPTYGHCYVYYATPKDYLAARTTCTSMTGFHLARVETSNEQPLIASLVGATALAYIGGNDIAAEGTYVWDDGTLIQLTSWNTGEPNNGAAMFEEDCIVVNGPTGGHWDDRPCSPAISATVPGEYGYVCERD